MLLQAKVKPDDTVVLHFVTNHLPITTGDKLVKVLFPLVPVKHLFHYSGQVGICWLRCLASCIPYPDNVASHWACGTVTMFVFRDGSFTDPGAEAAFSSLLSFSIQVVIVIHNRGSQGVHIPACTDAVALVL